MAELAGLLADAPEDLFPPWRLAMYGVAIGLQVVTGLLALVMFTDVRLPRLARHHVRWWKRDQVRAVHAEDELDDDADALALEAVPHCQPEEVSW